MSYFSALSVRLKYYYFSSTFVLTSSIDVVFILSTIHVISSQLSGHCDVISNSLWRHQQNENWASESRERCLKSLCLSSFMDSLYRVRNKTMYVLPWRTVPALTRVPFGCLFPPLLRNAGNIHQNITLVSAEQFVARVHTLFSVYSCGMYCTINRLGPLLLT